MSFVLNLIKLDALCMKHFGVGGGVWTKFGKRGVGNIGLYKTWDLGTLCQLY